MNDSELQQLLASAMPLTDDDVASARLSRAADEMRGAIVKMNKTVTVGEHTSGRRPGKRSIGVLAAATTVAVLIGGTAAAAVLIEARTGRFGMGAGSEDGSGEFIRLDAPGSAEIVDDLGADIPLPPGGSFERLKENFLRAAPDGVGVEMSESGIVGTLSLDAACQWTGYWLDGFERGDSAQKQAAQTMLDQIPTWQAIVSSDAGGLVDQLRRRADGARSNDPSKFLQDYQINCTHELSPIGD